VELELQVCVAQVSQLQKDTVVRQLAALLHVLDSDIALKGLHGQSDIRYYTHINQTNTKDNSTLNCVVLKLSKKP